MLSTRIDGIDKPLSRIIMGTMIIGLQNYVDSAALLDSAMKLGINAFDIASVYSGGDSERAIGKWMEERGNRDDVFIITKGAHPNKDRKRVTPYDITADLMDSLARLKTDYIDVYLLHRDDPDLPVGPIMDCLHEHLDAGRIRVFGVSNWTHERIAQANVYAIAHGQATISVSSPNYGLCEQVDDPWGPGCVSISGDAGAEAREFYVKENMPVMAYSSLGRGMLSGRVTRENYLELLDGAAIKAYAHEVNFERLDRVRELIAKWGCGGVGGGHSSPSGDHPDPSGDHPDPSGVGVGVGVAVGIGGGGHSGPSGDHPSPSGLGVGVRVGVGGNYGSCGSGCPSVPQIALAYILCQPMNVFPIVGAASPIELEAAAASVNITLTQQEIKWLEKGI